MYNYYKFLTLLILFFSINSIGAQTNQKIESSDLFPWCIVAYDSLERTPKERIQMIKELGFTKYAYDWRDKHLVDSKNELILSKKNNIEVMSVWLWLNAKRDSLNKLSLSNEKIFKIVEELNIQTTFWVSLSGNFFKDLSHQESLEKAINYIKFISEKAKNINCKVALYNHSGWFGNPLNQIEIIKALPTQNLSLVYNFHHARNDIDNFSALAPKMAPYLSAVNLNGVKKTGDKILAIGKGDYEKEMIQKLFNSGFSGPWGILGHVENVDVKPVLINNIKGFNSLFTDQ